MRNIAPMKTPIFTKLLMTTPLIVIFKDNILLNVRYDHRIRTRIVQESFDLSEI
jgi:hypothetical protein